MITEDEARSALRMAELMVKNGVDRGCPKSPTTPLEKHAFELGRVSVLRWVCPEEKADDATKTA